MAHRSFLLLNVWLALAILLSSGFGLSSKSVAWWLLVAPPAVLYAAFLAIGFGIAVFGLIAGLLARK